MEYNIYRLKDIKPKSFQLPLKETFVKKFTEENGQKKDLGYRRIVYVPGTDTIFKEDIKGDLQPESIWFEDGDVQVRVDDKLKNAIMTQHPWFGIRYDIWSPEKEEMEKLEVLRFKSETAKLIDDSEEGQMKAIALAVFGVEAQLWSPYKCELELRQKANDEPKELQKIMKDTDYESKFIAAQAFVSGLVRENKTKTAVEWSDSEGIIIKLAKGENGVLELGRFIANRTQESIEVMQSIGERLDAIKLDSDNKDVLLKEKDKQIATLQKTLEEKDKGNQDPPELIEARLKYAEATGKEVPVNMKNNAEWLLKNAIKPEQ